MGEEVTHGVLHRAYPTSSKGGTNVSAISTKVDLHIKTATVANAQMSNDIKGLADRVEALESRPVPTSWGSDSRITSRISSSHDVIAKKNG